MHIFKQFTFSTFLAVFTFVMVDKIISGTDHLAHPIRKAVGIEKT